nr:immunoglobulin heavy chain junction region [Macaca mulatta]
CARAGYGSILEYFEFW